MSGRSWGRWLLLVGSATIAHGCRQIIGWEEAEVDQEFQCNNGVHDGGETDIDCGGACASCPDLHSCHVGADCQSLVCMGGTCRPPVCNDGITNGGETDVDCGNACSSKCGPGKSCAQGNDCTGGVCDGGACAATCTDESRNALETDIDCGGPKCPACGENLDCLIDGDCSSGVCGVGKCLSNHAWSKIFGDPADNQVGVGVTVDAAGSIMLTGGFAGTISFGGPVLAATGSGDAFVVKLGASGNHIWSKQIGGQSGSASGIKVLADSRGGITVTGGFTGSVNVDFATLASQGGLDGFIARYDTSSAYKWSYRVGGTPFESVSAASVNVQGETVAALSSSVTLDFGTGPLPYTGGLDIFLAKYSPSGFPQVTKSFGDKNNQYPGSIEIDDLGNIYLTGQFEGTLDFGKDPIQSAGAYDIFLAKLDPSGAPLWSARFGDAADQPRPVMSISNTGDIVLAGKLVGTINLGGNPLTSTPGNTDLFLARLDTDGNHLWSRSFPCTGDCVIRDVKLDAAGNILLTGSLTGSLDLGGGLLESAGGADVFIAKLDPAGNHLYSRRFGDALDQLGYGISATPDPHEIVVIGNVNGIIDFGGPPLESAGGSDVFLAKLRLP